MPTDEQLTAKLKEEHAIFRSESDMPRADIGIITRYWPNVGREWISTVAEWLLTNHVTVDGPMVNGRVRAGTWTQVRVYVDYLPNGQPAVFEVLRKGDGLTLDNLNLERSCRKNEDATRFEMVATLPTLSSPDARTGTTYRIDGIRYDIETNTFSGFVVTSVRKYQHIPRHTVHSDAFSTLEVEEHLGCKYYSGSYHSDSGTLSIPTEQATQGIIINVDIGQSDHCTFDIVITWDTAVTSVSRMAERSAARDLDETTTTEIDAEHEDWKAPVELEAVNGHVLRVTHKASRSGLTDQTESDELPHNQTRTSVSASHREIVTEVSDTEANAEDGTLKDPESIVPVDGEVISLDQTPTEAGNTKQRYTSKAPTYQHTYEEYATRYGMAYRWWGINATEEEYDAILLEADLTEETRNNVDHNRNAANLIDYTVSKMPYQVEYDAIEDMIQVESCSLRQKVWFYPKEESREARRYVVPTTVPGGWKWEYDPRQRDDGKWDIHIRATLTRYRHVSKFTVRDDSRLKVEQELHLGAKSGSWGGYTNDSGSSLSIPTPTVSDSTQIVVDKRKRDSCVTDITITFTTLKDQPGVGGGVDALKSYTSESHTHNDTQEDATAETGYVIDVDNQLNDFGGYKTRKTRETFVPASVPEYITGSQLEIVTESAERNADAPVNPGQGAQGEITSAGNTINKYGRFDGHQRKREAVEYVIPESVSGSDLVEVTRSGTRNTKTPENPGAGAVGIINTARNSLNAFALFDTDLTVEVANAREYLGVKSGGPLAEVTDDIYLQQTSILNPGPGADGTIISATNNVDRFGCFNSHQRTIEAKKRGVDSSVSSDSEDVSVTTESQQNDTTWPTASSTGPLHSETVQAIINQYGRYNWRKSSETRKLPNGGKPVSWTTRGPSTTWGVYNADGTLAYTNVIAHIYDHTLRYTTNPTVSGEPRDASISYAGDGIWAVRTTTHRTA